MDKLIAKLIREERSPLLWQKNPPEIYLGSAGHIRMETGPATHPLTAYYIAVIWGIGGRICIDTTEEAYRLESGQVCLISHGTRFTVDIESAWGEFIYFSIDGKASEGILENYDLWQGVFPGGNAPMEVLDSILAGLAETGKSVVRTNVVHVLDLLDTICRRTLRRAPDKAVREAEILIRRSFRDPSFNINRVCEQLKLHRSGLSKRFRNITGNPPPGLPP